MASICARVATNWSSVKMMIAYAMGRIPLWMRTHHALIVGIPLVFIFSAGDVQSVNVSTQMKETRNE